MEADDLEIWCPVEGLPYEVSNQGNIRRSAPGKSTRQGRLLSPSLRRDGYLRVNLQGTVHYLHRIICETFHGKPRKPRQTVVHINGDVADNRPVNLMWRDTGMKRCAVCGMEFRPRKVQLRAGRGKYCSRQCAGKALSGEANPMYGCSITEEQKEKWRATCEENQSWRRGADNPNWKGGRYLQAGYWFRSINGRKVAEHRWVMEKALGRKLSSDEIVHHKNRNTQDNRLENLQIMTRAEHAAEHMPERKRNGGSFA